MPEVRVYWRTDCVINPKPPVVTPLGAAFAAMALGWFVPKVIESAISGVANALKKAGDKETKQLAGRTTVDLFVTDEKQALRPNVELACLLVVWFERASTTPADNEAAQRVKAAGLIPADAALLGAWEALVDPSEDGTAFTLDTRYFSAREFIGDRSKREREYLANITLALPDATEEGKVFALATVPLGTVKKTDEFRPDDAAGELGRRRRSNLMPWARMSAASRAAYTSDVAVGLASHKRYMPSTVTVTISETADGNDFLLKLGGFLAGSATTLAGAISKEILPKDAEAEVADATAAETLYQNEIKAELELLDATAQLASALAADVPAATLSVESATRKRDFQRRLREAAGLPARS